MFDFKIPARIHKKTQGYSMFALTILFSFITVAVFVDNKIIKYFWE